MTEQLQDTPEADPVWAAWRASGDLEARNELLLRYSPLVKYVAGRVRTGLPRSVEHADVVSEGMIGLIDALEKFEPERGLAFPTYAVPRIRGAIFDSVRAADWVPRSVRTRAREVEQARAALHERLGRAATDAEVAAETGLRSPSCAQPPSRARGSATPPPTTSPTSSRPTPGSRRPSTTTAPASC